MNRAELNVSLDTVAELKPISRAAMIRSSFQEDFRRTCPAETVMRHATTSALKYCLALGSCVVHEAYGAEQCLPDLRRHNSGRIPRLEIDRRGPASDRQGRQLRARLGNAIAIEAFKEGKIPFPDGTIIAALHWNRVPSKDNDKILVGAFPGAQSFVVGSAVNVQVMVKDSKKYAATGGWGFGDFKDGKPGDEALHKTCFGCHEPAKAHDFVFAHYAPRP